VVIRPAPVRARRARASRRSIPGRGILPTPAVVALPCDGGRYFLRRGPGNPGGHPTAKAGPTLRTVSRQYQPGDEVQINRLYRLIAGRDRSVEEFAWEWLDTWAGPGSMNLVFDLDREEGDQLIAQYSLIPTPLSVHGRPVLAGKTENCMSHPDHRGTGLYSAHERECFEREKERYRFFFTTAGEVAGGAVGRVRVKLGYRPFDNWAKYTVWLRTAALREELRAMVAAKGKIGARAAPALAGLLAAALQTYSRLRRRRVCRYRTAVHGAADAPLEEIASLWERNRARYGITVDRTTAYLRWRVNEDPYIEHEYLTMRDDGRLLGYVVAYVDRGTLYVVDLLTEGASTALFRHLLAALLRRGRELGVDRVRCVTLRRSRLLPRRLRSAGFLDIAVLSPAAYVSSRRPRQFFLYVPEELRDDPTVADPAGWYLTELVLEGRLRGRSPA